MFGMLALSCPTRQWHLEAPSIAEKDDDNYSLAVHLADEKKIPLTAEVASNSEGVEVQTYSLGGNPEGKYNFLLQGKISDLVAILDGRISDPVSELIPVGSTVTGIEVFNCDGVEVAPEDILGDHAQATLTMMIKFVNSSGSLPAASTDRGGYIA